MQNVAHGAQPDHEQPILGLGLQVLIFSQGQLHTARYPPFTAYRSAPGSFRTLPGDAFPVQPHGIRTFSKQHLVPDSDIVTLKIQRIRYDLLNSQPQGDTR
jgi:hypothetical protein